MANRIDPEKVPREKNAFAGANFPEEKISMER